MINYDPRNFLQIIFTLKGSVLPGILVRIFTVAAIGVGAVFLFKETGFKLPTIPHTMVGVALGLLLVFRTNASFDRWWEGRKLLGSMVNRARDLTRQVANLVEGEDEETQNERQEIQRMITAYYALMRQHLRHERDLSAVAAYLTEQERETLDTVTHRPVTMCSWISSRLVSLARKGKITEQRLQSMDTNLTVFHDNLGACERILKTPVPFAYAQHIKTFLVLFVATAPFAMADTLLWGTPVAIAVLAFALFGIDEIGVEIEDPFGTDPNDLPLDAIGDGINATTKETLKTRRSAS